MKDLKASWITWIFVSLVVVYLSWEVIRPFLSPIFFAIIAAYLFFPIYREIRGFGFSEKVSSGILSCFLGLILVVLIYGSYRYASSVVVELRGFLVRIPGFIKGLEGIPVSWEVIFADISNLAVSKLTSFTLSLPKILLQSLVFIILFWYFMIYSDFLLDKLMSYLPHDRENLANRLVNKANITLKAVLRVWLLLSFIKSILVGIGFSLFVTTPTWSIVIGFIAIFLEILPVVGGWVLWTGGSIYLISMGNYLNAILLGIYGFVLIAPLPDIFVRPKLAAQGAQVNYVIMLIGMLGGILAFGFKGLVLGPISLSLMTVLLKEWEKEIRK